MRQWSFRQRGSQLWGTSLPLLGCHPGLKPLVSSSREAPGKTYLAPVAGLGGSVGGGPEAWPHTPSHSRTTSPHWGSSSAAWGREGKAVRETGR